ncbi:MAG: DNA-processing protein DprA [Candidatus Margulisiibacteriota bacterium]
MTGDLDIWLALQSIPGLGASRLKTLRENFHPISKLRALSPADIARADGIGGLLAQSICEKLHTSGTRSDVPEFPDGVNYVTISEKNYPKNLFNIYDPPPVLYVKGEILEKDQAAVAVVGTRNPSQYGLRAAEFITKRLVESGLTVVSGLAAGIDACSHDTALRCGGRTIAVLASGLEEIYPYFNKRLSEDIVRTGALVSEMCRSPHRFEKWSFPKRNRIISGLSLGTVVIEGARDSGSLITAGFALEQNREVFAVPGAIFSKQSIGPNSLIKSGAKLVQTVEDILEELPVKTQTPRTVPILHTLTEEE